MYLQFNEKRHLNHTRDHFLNESFCQLHLINLYLFESNQILSLVIIVLLLLLLLLIVFGFLHFCY